MSRAVFVILFLLTIPHLAEARASGTETPIRPMLICENHTSSIDARDCIDEPRPQKHFAAAPVVTSNPLWRERPDAESFLSGEYRNDSSF
jgi:hypothetical protein